MDRPRTPRHDGWTPERQLVFLAALAQVRSVTAAAAAAGMSRESAHRLRNRQANALFAHLWDLALAPAPPPPGEGHTPPLSDGRLARMLGNQFRRESGNSSRVGIPRVIASAGHRA